MPHVFNAEGRSRLDAPERDEWQQPDRLVEALNLQSGSAVADIGAGTGYFAVRMAAAVGQTGRVYGVDVQHQMLDALLAKVAEGPIRNIIPVYSDGVNIPLPAAEVDLVFSANVAHEFTDLPGVMSECARILRPQGRVVIVDWKPKPSPVGPPVDHRVHPDRVAAAAAQAGLQVTRSGDDLQHLLPHQYVLQLSAG